jgi:hypothetical protein
MGIVDKISTHNSNPSEKTADVRQLDAIAWGLFLIWIGVAVLADVGWGWALLGMSAIILGAQAAHWRSAGAIDVFSVVCGIVFLVGGTWTVLGLTWPLAPILLILLGAGMLWNAAFNP